METTIELFIALASGLVATTYGHGEMSCGDIGRPRACAYGATTASGEVFDPSAPTAAIAAPTEMRMSSRWVWLRLADGPHKCVRIRVNDKSNPRWIGVRGFDLTPSAVARLGGKPSATWSGRVDVCHVD